MPANTSVLPILRDQWYVLCSSDELATEPVGRVVCETPMVAYRGSDGRVVVLYNLCPHRRAPLSMGRVEGDCLRCAYHGMLFDQGGRCVEVPSQEHIPPRARVETFPCIERYGFVWVWPGRPDQADPARLPDLHWREQEDWDRTIVQHFSVEAPYALMVDNLLDLSHVAFLHRSSIGFDPGDLGDDPLEVTTEGDSIVCERVFRGVGQAPAHRSWFPIDGKVDRTQRKQWYAPTVVSVLSRNQSCADGGVSAELRADHFITPESPTSHHYYVAMSRTFRVGDPEFSAKMDFDTRAVHMEDVEMVQAQQSMVRWAPDSRDMALKADRAVSAGRRALRRLAEAEGADVDLAND